MQTETEKYTIPSFESLSKSTEEILKEYNKTRKQFVPPSLQDLMTKIPDEFEKYLRENDHGQDRYGQARVFTQLVGEFSKDPNLKEALSGKLDNSGEVVEYTRTILLGMLIHRRLRMAEPSLIQEVASNANDALKKYSWFKAMTDTVKVVVDVVKPLVLTDEVRLLALIELVLGMSEENQLDNLTIYTACNAYYKYMVEKNRYKNYEHLRVSNFKTNFDPLITKYKRLAEIQENAIKYSLLLSSFCKSLQDIHVKVRAVATELLNELSEYDDTTIERIDQILFSMVMDDSTRARVKMLYLNEYFKNNISEWSFQVLSKAFFEALDGYSEFALFGAYMTVYHLLKPDDLLLTTIRMQLNFGQFNILLDNQTCYISIENLEKWFLNFKEDAVKIQWKFYVSEKTGLELFKQQCTQAKKQLAADAKLSPEPTREEPRPSTAI